MRPEDSRKTPRCGVPGAIGDGRSRPRPTVGARPSRVGGGVHLAASGYNARNRPWLRRAGRGADRCTSGGRLAGPLGMRPRLAAVATEVRGHRRAQHEVIGRCGTSSGIRRDSHTSRCVTRVDERQHASSSMRVRSIGERVCLRLVAASLSRPASADARGQAPRWSSARRRRQPRRGRPAAGRA